MPINVFAKMVIQKFLKFVSLANILVSHAVESMLIIVCHALGLLTID